MNNPRYLHTVYCDDIRQEVGGKTVQVGIYGGRMNIAVDEAYLKKNGGVTVPKLCLVTTLSSPAAKPMKKVVFNINLNGKSIASFDAEMPPLPEGSDIKYQTINSVNTISLTVRESGVLNVTAKLGKQLLEGPDLIINLVARKSEKPQTAPVAKEEPVKTTSSEETHKNLGWLGRR